MSRFIISMALLLLTSCGSSVSFVSIMELPQAQWKSDQWVEFEFNKIKDNTPESIYLLIRHKSDFEFAKINLEIVTVNPKNQYWSEKISIPLADTDNQWLGRKNSTNYDLRSLYRSGVRLTETGKYTIKIRYTNPEPTLLGIQAVGLTIEQDGKE